MLAALLLFQQTQTVTFSHPVASSSVVLEALGKIVGRPMRATGSVTSDFLKIELQGIPLGVATAKIAEALNARWIESKGVLYLERTPAQEAEDFDTEYDSRAEAVRRAIRGGNMERLAAGPAEALAVKVRDFGETRETDDWNRFQPIAQQLPGNRAMRSLIALIDLGQLVRSLRPTVEYANRPGKVPLPAGARSVIDRLAEDWSVYADAAARVGLSSDDVYLKVERSADFLEDNLHLIAHINEASVLFMLSFVAGGEWQTIGYQIVPTDGNHVPEWVAELREPADLSEAARQSITPGLVAEGRDVLRSSITEPALEDAALAAPSQLLLQAAGKRSLIAVVPDSAYLALARLEVGPTASAATLLGAMFSTGAIVAERDDAWLVSKPAKPYSARDDRMNRAAFQAMCRYATENGALPLDEFADFMATTETDSPLHVAVQLFGRAVSANLGVPTVGTSPIRIYGRLSRAERTRARREPVDITDRTDFRRFARALTRNVPDFEDRGMAAILVRRPLKEAEDALALLPKGAACSVRLVSNPGVVPYFAEQRAGAFFLPSSIENFAVNYVMAERTGPSQGGFDFSRVASVLGDTVFVEIRGSNGGSTAVSRYSDPLQPVTFGSIQDLPQAVRSALEKAIAQARRGGGG